MLHTPIGSPAAAVAPPARRIAPGPGRPAGDPRAEALGRTAPWLAGLSLACAAIVLWPLAPVTAPLPLAGWVALVAALNLAWVRMCRRDAGAGAAGRRRSTGRTVAEAVVLAASWSILPATMSPAQPPAMQLLLGAATTMMAGAILLAVVPLAATAWTLTIAAGLVWALHRGGGAILADGLLLAVHAGAVIVGCFTIERILKRQADAMEEVLARGDAIALLLREHEEQGTGWLWRTDAHHCLTYASPRLCERLGRTAMQLAGQSLPMLIGRGTGLGRAMATGLPFADIEIAIATVGGTCRVVLSATPIPSATGAFAGYRGHGTDVTEARRAEERIRRVALLDDLTGLPNRQRLRGLLAEALATGDTRTALLFIDLDGFKPVNDRYGHAVGDAVLRVVADRLAAATGSRGHVGRLGGDEFAIVLPKVDGRGPADALAARIFAALEEPIEAGGGAMRVGLSIGCAITPGGGDGDGVDGLLERADIALYQAKSHGRGRMTLFDPAMQRDVEERARLEQDLRHALARDELRLDYQPVIDVASQTIVGFEALLRWAHPVRGLVPPLIFLPVAEECGLIGGFGEWVVRTACADAAGWPGSVFVSINLSRAQLAAPGLPAMIGEALLATRLEPSRLELEVTESIFHGEQDRPLDVLRRLRALGVGIALDDFGAGHASLGYLSRSLFHTLKLDGGFVRDAGGSHEALAVIRAIVALATGFRMNVTAEGIESFDDFARMKELGCQRVQGYLFGRPAPAAEVHALLAGHARAPAVRAAG